VSDESDRQRIDALRLALGASADEGIEEIEKRIREGDAKLAREVGALALAARIAREDAACVPDPDVMQRLRELARAHDVIPPRDEWLVALPVAPPAGVRGPVAKDAVRSTRTDDWSLTVALGTSPVARGRAPTGQLTRAADGSAFPDVELTLFADHRAVEQQVTDELGEFAFEAAEGDELVLRLDAGHGPHFVLLTGEERDA
jgi:hypothetical protein